MKTNNGMLEISNNQVEQNNYTAENRSFSFINFVGGENTCTGAFIISGGLESKPYTVFISNSCFNTAWKPFSIDKDHEYLKVYASSCIFNHQTLLQVDSGNCSRPFREKYVFLNM